VEEKNVIEKAKRIAYSVFSFLLEITAVKNNLTPEIR